MKKAIAYLFLFVYLFSVTEGLQLLKLPVLIEHYKEHKTKNRKLDVSQFLMMHYIQSGDNDNDGDRDQQLPFKAHHHDCINSFVYAFTNDYTFDVRLKHFVSEEKMYSVTSDSDFSSSYLSNIWQPPKQA